MSQDSLGAIDPTRAQFDAFKALPRDTPIHMLNLIRLRAQADYPPGHANHGRGLTGLEAYRAYGATTAAIFARVGGRQVWAGRPEGVVTGRWRSGGIWPSSRPIPMRAPSWRWSPIPTTACMWRIAPRGSPIAA